MARGLCSALGLLLAACGSGADLGPGTGALDITTATTGETTGIGYTLSLDGGAAEQVGLAGTLHRAAVEPGEHTVLLAGLTEGCALTGDNPRHVTVAPGATATVAFSVSCMPLVGQLQVVTSTSGPAPASFSLLLDGSPAGPIGSGASLVLDGVSVGAHTVGLSDLPASCQLQGTNPHTASVERDATATVTLTVTCDASNAQWTPMQSNTAEDLVGVWAASGTNAFAVSSGSTFHLDGDSWSRQTPAPPGASLTSIWGSSASDVFAVGSGSEGGSFPDGVILHSNGSAWTAMLPPASGSDITRISYLDVQGSSADNVYAAGDLYDGSTHAMLARFDGQAWSRVRLPQEDEHSLRDLFVVSPNDAWVGGVIVAPSDAGPGYAFAFHYNGVDWAYHTIAQQFGLRGIWAASPTDVFAVGQVNLAATVYHYDGTAWSRMTVPDIGPLNDVWGGSPSDLYAVGENGMLHYDGSGWTDVGVTGSLNHIWGASRAEIFAVGKGGRILRALKSWPAGATGR
jgi:hypothetical protein